VAGLVDHLVGRQLETAFFVSFLGLGVSRVCAPPHTPGITLHGSTRVLLNKKSMQQQKQQKMTNTPETVMLQSSFTTQQIQAAHTQSLLSDR
jgi:hypothetical protein